ncbi:uncharacterized protein LOC117327200 [Pecten maximus]|uniref:uncharacterized protein LOC117327200 n=1 Tax=Pecten maximus TaxID=6579 RepID=UPI0014583BFD|nr:uncharacterized protein LOC117327200 [Pecten maximus]
MYVTRTEMIQFMDCIRYYLLTRINMIILSEARTKTDSGCGLKNEAVKQRGIPSEERQDQSMTSSTARSRVNIPTPETKTNTVDSGGDNLPKRSISSSPRPISNTVIAPSNRTSTKSMEHAAREMRPSCSSPISGQSCAKRVNNGQVYSFTTAEDDQFTFEFERGGSGPPFSIQKAQDVYPTVTTSENFMCIKTVSSIDPAAESGRIKSGDVILEVNGRSVKGLDLSKTETTLWAAGVHVNMLLCRPNHLMCRPKQLPTGPMIPKKPERTTVLPISKKKEPNLIGQTSNPTSALQVEQQPYCIASYHQHGEKCESDVREREHHETAGSVTDKSHSDLLDQKPVDTVERQKYPYQRDTIGEKQQDVIHKQEGQSGPNMMRENSKHLNTINTLSNPDDTNNTPSNPANTNNTPSDPAHTNKTPSRPVATSNTPSGSVATTNKTPSGSVATSNTPSDSVATSNTPSDPTDTNNTPAGYRSTGPNAQGPNHKSKTKNGRPANLAEHEDIDENGEMYNVPIGSGQRENEPCNGDNQLMAIPEQLPTGTNRCTADYMPNDTVPAN